AGGGDVAHGGEDGALGGAEFVDGVDEVLGGADGSAGGVDAQHHGADGGVLRPGLDLFDELGGVGGVAGAFAEDALDVEHGNSRAEHGEGAAARRGGRGAGAD